jgi:hypothetical protein
MFPRLFKNFLTVALIVYLAVTKPGMNGIVPILVHDALIKAMKKQQGASSRSNRQHRDHGSTRVSPKIF